MKEVVIGIDVGKKGGIARISQDGELELYQMPMIGKEYDIHELSEILDQKQGEIIRHVFIENVHAIQGRAGGSSNFSFGMGKGILMGLVAGKKLPYTLVNPKAWQKVSWEGVTKQSDTKKTSLVAAKRLFPDETFLATERSRVPHDGFIDAALIAFYGKLKIML